MSETVRMTMERYQEMRAEIRIAGLIQKHRMTVKPSSLSSGRWFVTAGSYSIDNCQLADGVRATASFLDSTAHLDKPGSREAASQFLNEAQREIYEKVARERAKPATFIQRGVEVYEGPSLVARFCDEKTAADYLVYLSVRFPGS